MFNFIDVTDINDIPKKDWIRVQCGDKNPQNTQNIVCYRGQWHHCSNWGSEAERGLTPIDDSAFFDIVSSWTDEGPYYFEGPQLLCFW